MKTLLCERQDSFYYCLLIYLIFLKPRLRSKDQLHQFDLRFKNTKAYRSTNITVYFNLTTDSPDYPDAERCSKNHFRSYKIIAKAHPSAGIEIIIANHLRSLQKTKIPRSGGIIADHCVEFCQTSHQTKLMH